MTVQAEQGRLSGVQYYIPGHHHTDVVCAVCYTSLSATFMVPGTNRCPADSAPQYHGYLTSTYYPNTATAEFLCLDAAPEDRMGSADQKVGAYIEHAVTLCGSLPCPPYVDRKVVTCVVCSK
nr:hypothetical protein BaRGS_016777 [Batillaria attramentaria]